MSVSISEIIAGASVRAVPLAGECAGYLVLAAADQAVAAPRRIGPKEVHLLGDGSVRVEGARAAAETDSEADLRALLDVLLMNASSATPALLRASRRTSGRGIAAFVREIETALIPVNRSAAHRALARLERETERARHAGRLEAAVPAMSRQVVAAPPAMSIPEPAPSEPSAPSVASAPSEPSAANVLGEASEPSELLLAVLPEIPSLLTPSVDAIAAYAAEIETRPEPIVARRSAPPPSRTPSPPAHPVASPRRSPPPLPVVEAPPTTPVFGTIVHSHSDDDMDIEVVFDDDLVDDELTGVLVRSTPLEVAALLESPISAAVSVPADLTEPCPPALEDESMDGTSAAPLEPELEPEETIVALVAEEPPAEPIEETRAEPVEEPPAEPIEATTAEPVEEPPVDAIEATTAEPVDEPPAEAEASPAVEEAPLAPARHVELLALDARPAVDPLPAVDAPLDEAFAFEAPPVELVAAVAPVDEPAPAVFEFTADLPPVELDGPGETQALALGIEPVVALPPPPRLPLPQPRPSDVEDLLERMADANAGGGDELRSSLKGIAGIEPTPPPPET